MKNTYVKPEMQVETFKPNSYCAGCGVTVDGDYLFTCDFPYAGKFYKESNGVPGIQTSGELKLTCTNTNRYHNHGNNCYTYIPADNSSDHPGYHACSETHKTKNLSDFKSYIYVLNGTEIPVTVWRGKSGYNWHVTTEVNQEHWTTVKNS